MRPSLRAPRANESFARLFKGGRVQGRRPWPPAAAGGTLLCFIKRRRGSKGEPSPGVPPFFTFVRVRRYVWALDLRPTARHPISFALAKRNGVSPKEKRPLARIFLIAGRTLCCTCRKQLPCPSGWHVRPRRRLPRASTSRLPTTSPSPGANGAFWFALTTERYCQRRVRPAIKKT